MKAHCLVAPLLATVLCAQIRRMPATLPEQPPNPEQTKGSIEGLVLNQATGEPIRKAMVNLGGTDKVLRAVTGADGRFVFRGLGPGAYYLNADKMAYLAPEGGWPPVNLGVNEQKSGIEVPLIPGASISGRVVNEYGRPVPGCNVNVGQFESWQGAGRWNGRGGGSTDNNGEYRVERLPAGRYNVTVQCWQQLPLPHPLMERDDPRVPYAIYQPQIYPAAQGFTGADKVAVAPGAEVRGVDFQVHRTAAANVRGRIASGGAAANRNVQVTLFPVEPSLRAWQQYGAGVDPQTGRFRFQPLPFGSYLLVAAAIGDGPPLQARIPIEVAEIAPPPIEVSPTAGLELKGTVQFLDERTQGQEAPRPSGLEGVRLNLVPLDIPQWWRHPSAQAGKDGTFTIAGIWPGRWRLEPSPGYVKSLRVGGEEKSPFGFALKGGEELTVALSTTFGRLTGPVPGDGQQKVCVVALPQDPAMLGFGLERSVGPMPPGSFELTLVPGHYRVFAVETPQVWEFMQRPALLQAMGEKRGQIVEVLEGGRASVAPDLITAAELKALVEEAR